MSLPSVSQFLRLKQLELSMKNAKNYGEWAEHALAHDVLSGAQLWKDREDSEYFDARQIRNRYMILRENCRAGKNDEVLFALNEGIHGNMGGMGRVPLYRRAKLGTKKLINQYVDQVVEALRMVAKAPENEISFEEKLDFFRRASHCYGRSALALSGGGGLIYFHHGVVDALLREKLLPSVLSGSSAGAWMCAQIGTRTDEELQGYFTQKRYGFTKSLNYRALLGMVSEQAREQVENDRDDVIDAFVEDLTFQEAFEKTGRYINISIAPAEKHQTSRLMNAITSPNVTIRSATRASSSVPGMVKPVSLEAKDSLGRVKPYLRNRRWVDGSFADDLPFKRMSRLFGTNHYVVSMINPLALPFMRKDPKESPDGLLKSSQKVLFTSFKESIKVMRAWGAPVAYNQVDALLGTIYRVLDQEYTGDVNLILDNGLVRSQAAFFAYKSESEIERLILAGQRATWPKLAQIRNAARISHTVDEILAELDQDSVVRAHSLTKSHHMV